MPDWSYRTVLRPLLFRLPTVAARDLTLGLMGTLGRSPVGPAVIDFLGHMRPPTALARERLGLRLPTAVGLGCGLDPAGRAASAFARFGVGFIEIGPITPRPLTGGEPIERCLESESIVLPEPTPNPGVEAIECALARRPARDVPLIVRLAVVPGTDSERAADEYRAMIERLAPYAGAFSLAADELLEGDGVRFRWVVEVARQPERCRPVLACVSIDLHPDEAERLAASALAAGADGLLVDGAVRTAAGRREIGRATREPALKLVARLRERLGPGPLIVGSGGVHEPEDALQLLEAGADFVQVDSGLVFSGPGLPKRINAAVLYAGAADSPEAQEATSPPLAEQSWFWTLLLGAGMLVGGVVALTLALSRVILAYDEHFVGLTRDQLMAVNERLLPFMAHDRATLAGTMMTIGVLYTGLSLFGIRAGQHWARVAVLASGFAGFATFFLFLGFGYFDPFHAFVTAILFQFFLLGLHCRLGQPPEQAAPPSLWDDWRWRLSQWGQLGLIAESIGFLAAGLTVAFVGVTQVFVAEDLEFMQTTADVLIAAGPRLVQLVAHDRATFGGMLFCSGVLFLLASLWGFGRGAHWLWWTILVAGLCGYGAAFGIHYAVEYHSSWHLAPAWVGLALFLAAMGLSYPYHCGRDPALEEAWRVHRARWARRHRAPREPDAGGSINGAERDDCPPSATALSIAGSDL